MNTRSWILAGLTLLASVGWHAAPAHAEAPADAVQAKKIWDAAPHNAFTDLIRHHDKWFCVFREGKGHVSPDGALRVLTSSDGEQWESAALVTMPDIDLRDAKICVTPKGQLMLCGAGVTQPPVEKMHQSFVWFSDDGKQWSEPTAIGDKNFWIWRVTWHNGVAYGVGYATSNEPGRKLLRLYKSDDGKHFETLVADLGTTGWANESSLLFHDDGTAYCIARRDPSSEHKETSALLGTAQAPYTDWKWTELGVQIGGPQIIRLDDGQYVVAGRSYPGGAKTKVWYFDPQAEKKLTEYATVPSGGDTSYPGLVQQDKTLSMSYYSSHDKKTSIYLAKIKLP